MIVATRILQHLVEIKDAEMGLSAYSNTPAVIINDAKAKQFEELCWEKLPEKGFIVTERITLNKRKHIEARAIIIRKIDGKPQVLFSN